MVFSQSIFPLCIAWSIAACIKGLHTPNPTWRPVLPQTWRPSLSLRSLVRLGINVRPCPSYWSFHALSSILLLLNTKQPQVIRCFPIIFVADVRCNQATKGLSGAAEEAAPPAEEDAPAARRSSRRGAAAAAEKPAPSKKTKTAPAKKAPKEKAPNAPTVDEDPEFPHIPGGDVLNAVPEMPASPVDEEV